VFGAGFCFAGLVGLGSPTEPFESTARSPLSDLVVIPTHKASIWTSLWEGEAPAEPLS